MIRTAVWYLFFWFYMIGCIPPAIALFIISRNPKSRLIDPFVRFMITSWAKALLFVAGAKLTVVGRENLPVHNNICFMSNHQGGFDIPILMAGLQRTFGFIAKKELSYLPLLNGWITATHCVLINRKKNRDAVDAIARGAENIRRGWPMVIFPEGTRSRGDAMHRFKGGSLKLALRAEATIVPISIDGSYKLKEANGERIKSAEVRFTIHPPIETAGLSREDAAELAEKLQTIIGSVLPVKTLLD